MKKIKQNKDKPETKNLIKSIKEIQKVRTREESESASDGGSTGRSDGGDHPIW